MPRRYRRFIVRDTAIWLAGRQRHQLAHWRFIRLWRGCPRHRSVDALDGVVLQLVAQRADRGAENICRIGPVSEAMAERFEDDIALHVGNGPSHQEDEETDNADDDCAHGRKSRRPERLDEFRNAAHPCVFPSLG